mgnify:CR=1 FL=1
MIKLTDVYHQIIEKHGPYQLAVDMTCGHGYDTLILAKNASKVIAFDIQKDALQSAQNSLKSQNNIEFIHDNHINFEQYINEGIDVIVYNLGYLPKGSKEITTEASSTIQSLKKALPFLNHKGIIVIELYPHNPEEYNLILDYTKSLQNPYDVIKIEPYNYQKPPILIIIKKQ